MSDYDVSTKDVTDAAAFLRGFLMASLPDGDFTEGGVNDYVVDGHAYIVAYLLKQVKNISDRQSLRTIKNLPTGESQDEAADAIGDNLFLTRKSGTFAKMPAVIHLSQRVDSIVPRNTRFWRTGSNVFYIDSGTDIFVPASQLRPNVGSNGQVIDWVATIFLTASRVGADYNLRAGRFVATDQFSPYLLYVENITDAAFGSGVQSTSDFIVDAGTALSVRAPINARSNDVTLRAAFPGVDNILSVGYGDPELTRDLIREAASGVRLHVGGHSDIYLSLPIQEVTETPVVGASALRADNRIKVFHDDGTDFVAAGVQVGDILSIAKGIPEAISAYVIAAVRTNEVEISDNLLFSVASAELPGTTVFTYNIGNNYPSFNNKVVVTDSIQVSTARTITVPGAAILTGQPIYRIKRVLLINPPAVMAPFADSQTGLVQFNQRVNGVIGRVPRPGDVLQYSLEVLNPGESQSTHAIMAVHVGWPGMDLTGYSLEVVYDSLSGLEVASAYIENPDNRILAGNMLVRGLHPVYLAFTVPYALRIERARRLDGSLDQTPVTFNEDGAASSLLSFINQYSDQNPLDANLLGTQAKSGSSSVATIYPFSVEYDLLGPDGRVYHFATEDRVTVFPDGTMSARLLNPTDFGLPLTGYYSALKKQLLDNGVSTRTIRYLAAPGAVTFERRT